jgi:hypothetical protein
MAAKYDYIALKNQYVQGTMSIRALCEMNGIPTWSTVNARKNREEWDKLRAEFQRQVESRSLDALAEKRARKIAQIQLDALEVIHAGILKMAEDMDAEEEYVIDGTTKRRKIMRFYPADLVKLIDKFQTLIGQPSNVNENRNLNLSVEEELGPGEMRMLLAALRPQQPAIGPEGASPSIRPAEARSH